MTAPLTPFYLPAAFIRGEGWLIPEQCPPIREFSEAVSELLENWKLWGDRMIKVKVFRIGEIGMYQDFTEKAVDAAIDWWLENREFGEPAPEWMGEEAQLAAENWDRDE